LSFQAVTDDVPVIEVESDASNHNLQLFKDRGVNTVGFAAITAFNAKEPIT
jgi:hypothetical protein